MDPKNLFMQFFNTITIRTAAYPDPITIDLRSPTDPSTREVMQLLQPAITISGPMGTFDVAPYGMPSGVSSDVITAGASVGFGVLAAAAGLALLAFSAGKRSVRRSSVAGYRRRSR